MNISRKSISLLVITVALAAVMGSCDVYKKFEMPKQGLTGEYANAVAQPVDSSALGNLRWEQIFTDPALQALIRQALDTNTNLQNAKLNVDIAQAQLQGAKLSYLPAVSFSPNGAGVKYGSNGMSWGYSLPIAASWQVDIFGQLTTNKRRVQAAVLQSEAYRQAVQSQIIAGVAECYYTLVSLNNQLKIYKETAKNWEKSVQVMKDMKAAGRYTEVAVVQSQANYYSVLAAIPNIELSIHQVSNSLALLLNEQPRTFVVNPDSEVSLPATVSEGIPMSYLAARPDVSAAEKSLEEAFYSTLNAKSQFYPTLNLTPSGTYATLLGTSVIDPAKWIVDLAAQLTVPIFARGQHIAGLKAAKAQQQQALNTFKYTLLSAASEASDAFVTMSKTKEIRGNLEKQVDNLQKAVSYNEALQTLSTTTYLEVLNAQTSLLSSQITLENNKLNMNQAAISLYQALGGGR
jgi:NodT family efflux transporter outer membrane factor (OMF) lipoprotein